MAKLTDRRIRDARCGETDRWLGDGNGLWLRIRTNGTKTFVFRAKRQGKTTAETIGEWSPNFLINKARDTAAQRRRTLKGAAAGSGTVAELSRQYYTRLIEPRYKRPTVVKRYLDRDLASIGSVRVVTVTRAQLSELISKKVADGPVAANRLLAIVKQLFRYGVEIGWLDSSPADLLTRRIAGGEEKTRDRVLSQNEMRKLWNVCDGQLAHSPLFRFLLLSGQRIGEAQNAKWEQIYDGTWHIPDNKSSRPHWIPVSTAMQQVLDRLSVDGQFVFRQRTTVGAQAWLRRWCEREKVVPFTPHDLRRTCATGMNALGVAPHVVEKILNHTMPGVMAIYNRYDYADERKRALEEWGQHVLQLVAVGNA